MNLAVARRVPDSVRFWLQVDVSGSCWKWQGEINPDGYGRFYANRKGVMAHRYAYQFLKGTIAEQTLDHLCRTKSCVNPDHLEPCSAAENVSRAPTWNGNKTHCPQGHSLEDAYIYKQRGYATRKCRHCHRATTLRYLARRAE